MCENVVRSTRKGRGNGKRVKLSFVCVCMRVGSDGGQTAPVNSLAALM